MPRIEFEYLEAFQSLRCLYLTKIEDCTEIPPYSFAGNLEELEVTLTNLQSFQSVPASSTHLKTLVLSSNKITGEVPVLSLPKLGFLDLSKNMISGMRSIASSSLESLDKLELSGNRIAGVLPELNLAKLRALVLSHNQITDVSSLNRSSLPCLRALHLNNNRIEGKVPDLERFPKLNVCKLFANRLSEMADQSSPELADLDLSENLLTGGLPVLEMPKLLDLDVSCNRLVDLFNLQESALDSLESLTVYDNPLPEFPLMGFKNSRFVALVEPGKLGALDITEEEKLERYESDELNLLCENEKCQRRSGKGNKA